MSPALLLGIDEGTTAVKAALFDCELRDASPRRGGRSRWRTRGPAGSSRIPS